MIDTDQVVASLKDCGYVHVRQHLDLRGFRALCSELGHVVAEEIIALRGGAHAYVAKAGPVPFHTDQAQVEFVGWLCTQQDGGDGANLLLDSRPILDSLTVEHRDRLRRVRLGCPAICGGPPRFAVPVLRSGRARDSFFCSPWLEPVGADEQGRETLRSLRRAIEEFAVVRTVRIRLAPGEVLFVDNQRVMHGRDQLLPSSPRKLHRTWVITRETGALE